MDIALRPAELATRVTGLLAVGVHEGAPRRGTPAAELDVAAKGALKSLMSSGDFSGRAGETALQIEFVFDDQNSHIGKVASRDCANFRVRIKAQCVRNHSRSFPRPTLSKDEDCGLLDGRFFGKCFAFTIA